MLITPPKFTAIFSATSMRRTKPSGEPANGKEHAMQAGARRYPEPPMPAQHLKKPGEEADLELAPMYDAPY